MLGTYENIGYNTVDLENKYLNTGWIWIFEEIKHIHSALNLQTTNQFVAKVLKATWSSNLIQLKLDPTL